MFDKIFSLPGIRVFKPLYEKHKSVLLYLFFGALTTVISIFSFVFLDKMMKINVLFSNGISWVLAVAFAYFTNKKWVFESSRKGMGAIKEAVMFAGARITTLLIEEGLIFVFVVCLTFDSVLVKTVGQVVVLVLNYVFSKLFIFRKKGKKC